MPLTREESYGKVILYNVKQEFLSREKRQKRSPSNSKTLNTTATFVVLYDLPLCSRYNVFVRAYTKAGPGPYTQPRVLETSSEYDHDVLAHKHVHVMHDDENISGILFNQNLFSGIYKYQRKPCSLAWVLVYSVLYMLDTVRDKFLGLAGLTCGLEYYNSYGYHAQRATLEIFFCTPSMLEGLGRLLDSLLLVTFTTGQ